MQIFTKYQLGWIEQQFGTEITAALEILDLLDEDIATAIIFTEPEEQELLFGVPITDFIGFTACGLNILAYLRISPMVLWDFTKTTLVSSNEDLELIQLHQILKKVNLDLVFSMYRLLRLHKMKMIVYNSNT